MAGERLVEELTLDISPALTALEPLGTALDGIITGFSGGLGDAISTVLGQASAIDTTPLTAAVESAITDATSNPVPLAADLTAFESTLADALDAPRSVPVDADISGIIASIDDATDIARTVAVDADVTAAEGAVAGLEVPVTVPVDADVAPAEAAIDGIVAAPVDVPVDADTTNAASAIDNLTAQPVDLSVDADTGEAAAAIEALAEPVVLPVEADVEALNASLADVFDAPRSVEVEGDTDELAAAIGAVVEEPQTVPVEADTTEAQIEIQGLAQEAVTVDVDADTAGLAESITEITDVGQTVPVDGDTSALESAVADALDEPRAISVDADTAPAQATLESLVAEPITIPVEADTGPAQESIDELSASATVATNSVDSLSGGVEGLSVAGGLAKGEVGELGGFISNINAQSAIAVSGLVAFTGFLGTSASLAADAQAQNKRFTETFGELAEQVEQIDVGGLRIDLADLGRESGTTRANLEATASRIGLLGRSADASDEQIVNTTQNLLALGATVAVNNPRLGDAATVTDKLTAAFAKGGRALVPFGIALTSGAIEAQALKENVGKTADELTIFDKATAGANLALGQFGDTLGTRFQDGAKNAQVQFRAMKVEIEETLAAVGGPLLEPLIGSLHDAIPVAQELGLTLGALAEAILPIVTALGPVLVPVAGALHLVADGFGAIASGIDAVPQPVLLGIAAGIAAIGAAALVSTFGVGFLGAAIVTALGPVGLVIAAVGILGAATNLFGADAASAQDVTEAWSEELFGAASGADTLSGQVAKLDANVTDVVTKFVEAAEVGSEFRSVLDGAGGGVDGLRAAITGSDADFKAYVASISSSSDSVVGAAVASDAYGKALGELRQGLLDSEAAQIANLRSTKQVSDEQIAAARATVIAKFGYENLGAELKILTANADEAAAAQQRATLAQSQHTGALREAVAAFDPASDSVADYTARLVELGVAEEDASTLAGDQVKALQDTRDQTILASGAVLDLNLAFVQGRIGAGELEGGVFGLGASLSAAQGEAARLTGEIDAFAQTAISALPTAGAAVEAFDQEVQSAFGNLVSATKAGETAVEAAQKKVTAAQEALSKAGESASTSAAKSADSARKGVTDAEQALTQAQEKAQETAAKTVATAQASLDAANRRVQALRASGVASASAIDSAQLAVTTAQERLNRAIADGSSAGASSVESAAKRVTESRAKLNETISAGGAAGASSIKNAREQLAQANADLVAAQEKAGVDVTAAQAALERAVDPQAFIDQLIAETQAIADFERNIATLVSEGLGNLAGTLASKGSEAGGALAQAFVDDKTQAVMADNAVRGLTLATDAADAYAHSPAVATAMGAAGQALADPINRGFAGQFAITQPTQAQLDAAALLITAAQPSLTGVAQATARAGVVAFEGEFGRLPTVAEIQAGRTREALGAATGSISTAAGTVGAAASTGFEGGLDLHGKTTAALSTVPAAFTDGEKAAAAAAAVAGTDIGGIFDFGIAQGMAAPLATKAVTDAAVAVVAAAEAAAKERLGIKSPSTVGIEIGDLFIAGIAQGLANTGPLSEAAGAITSSLSRITIDAIDTEQLKDRPPIILPVSLDTAKADVQLKNLKIPNVALAPTAVTTAVTTAAASVDLTTIARALQTGAGTTQTITREANVKVDLHKVDVNPTELSQELGWRLG